MSRQLLVFLAPNQASAATGRTIKRPDHMRSAKLRPTVIGGYSGRFFVRKDPFICRTNSYNWMDAGTIPDIEFNQG